MQIGFKQPFVPVIRVGYVVSGQRPLAGDLAHPGH